MFFSMPRVFPDSETPFGKEINDALSIYQNQILEVAKEMNNDIELEDRANKITNLINLLNKLQNQIEISNPSVSNLLIGKDLPVAVTNLIQENDFLEIWS